jgi:putative Mn2+ efflux pump MntP
MDILSILGISIGLAMDAFAVALAASAALRGATARQTFRFAFHFGLFQLLMPVVGWAAGLTVERWVAAWDHWVAFGLLVAIGGKMLASSFGEQEEERSRKDDPTRGLSLVVLSLATSIDALAVGFSFAMLRMEIWYPSLVIGIVAAGFTLLGMRIGSRLGRLFGQRAEMAGGAILVLIGLKIVLDHTT